MKLCKCGCGNPVTKECNNYIVGHWIKGKTTWNKNRSWTKEEKKILSESAIKKFKNKPELRKKCGYSKLTYERLKEKYSFFCKVEEIKKDNNNNVLVKCKKCDKFFIPNNTQLLERIRSLKHPTKNINNFFYCSIECKKSCKYYNRHVNIDTYDLNRLKEYEAKVRVETEISIKQNYNKIKNIELRGNKFGYQVDHKYSITEGFKNEIESSIISNWRNLEVITRKENSDKKSKCSIKIEELIYLIENDGEFG